MQPDAIRSRGMPLAVGYTWDGSGSIEAASGLVGRLVSESGRLLRDGTSGIPQSGVDAGVGDVLAVVEALGVDAQEHFHAVSGPLGDPWRGDTGR